MTAKTLAAAALAVVALAACGSSQKPHSTAGSRTDSQPVEFANCMRAHGVPNFPDPTVGGGGINLPAGINPQSPAFEAARQTCAKLTPAGPSGPPRATESQFLAAVNLAKCVRAHGFPDFPDPTHSDSPAPIVELGAGLLFHVSSSFDPNTPEFQRAGAACGGQ